MKKLVLGLTFCLAVCLLSACSKPEKPAPTPALPTPRSGEIITTAPPQTPSVPESTPQDEITEPAPPQSPAPSPASHEPTPAAPSEAPVSTPSPAVSHPPASKAQGSFRGDSGTALCLLADWTAASISETELRLTVTVSLESYSLSVGERQKSSFTLGGETTYFRTDAVEVADGSALTRTQLFIWSGIVHPDPDGSLRLPLSISWRFDGTYSGKALEDLTLDGEIRI